MRDISKIRLTVKPVAKGHQPHCSGAGQHGDRRTKRLRTRAAQKHQAMREW
jgi:hypothetical protein